MDQQGALLPAIKQGNLDSKDERYGASALYKWPWEQEWEGYQVLFLQHVVEHMRYDQFEMLISQVTDAKSVFIQSPLELGPTDWTGYNGAHIIEEGWVGIDAAMIRQGYVIRFAFDGDDVNSRTRIYRRV